MAETSERITHRRARRQRRLAQRLRTQLSARAPLLANPRIRALIGVAVAVMVATVALITRSSPVAIERADDDVLFAAFDPDELRPDVDEAEALPEPTVYTVEAGDTLLGIALTHGTSVEAIRVASGLPNADLLNIGQVLVIPPASSVLQPVDPYMTVREIASTFNTVPEAVAAYNGRGVEALDEPLARPLAVLPPMLAEPPTRQLASARGVQAADVSGAAESQGGEATTYTVSEGDTILSIALRLGVEPANLVAANRLSNSDLIVVGDTLDIPVWSRPAGEEVAAPARETLVRAASLPDDGATEATTPERPRTPIVYEVAPGDTVRGLAEQFGVDADTIVFTNELRSADRISIGDQLTILPVSGLMYSVRPGDTLVDIAATFKVDLGPIIDFNYLDDSDLISVGKELILPGARPLPPPPPARPALPATYVVQPGDTVGGIAYRYGVDSADVIAANNLHSADRISVGSELRIVAGAAQTARPAAPAAQTTTASRPAAQTTTASRPAAAPAPAQQVTVNRPVPAPAPAAATRQSVAGGGGSVASTAMQFAGYRYVFGGTTPAGFDCSGFVYYVHNRTGHSISRGMWGQYNAGSHPSRSALQPGDIVFFQNTYMPGLSHNGIYIGGGQFIHASDERSGVKVSSMSESYWSSRYFGATRAW